MPRPPLFAEAMTAAEGQHRHRSRNVTEPATPAIPPIPLRIVVGLVNRHGDGGWRTLRWIADSLDASPDAVERVLIDIRQRPNEYGLKAECRQRDGKWRLVVQTKEH
jgi:hypothetical protein